ncbi:hypothetical protein STEG23_019451 [Scotinomys teguina]
MIFSQHAVHLKNSSIHRQEEEIIAEDHNLSRFKEKLNIEYPALCIYKSCTKGSVNFIEEEEERRNCISSRNTVLHEHDKEPLHRFLAQDGSHRSQKDEIGNGKSHRTV